MSPATGSRPNTAFTSALVGAELSLAVRVTTKVAEPSVPLVPFVPLEPLAPLAPLYAIALIG